MGVISAATSNQIGSIFGLDDPREIRYFNGRIYVAESNTGALRVFDANTLAEVTGSPVAIGGGEADSLALDTANNRIFVGMPQGPTTGGFVAVIDLATLTQVAGSPFASGSRTTGVAYDPVRNRILACNDPMGTGDLVILDGTTFTATPPIAAGNRPSDVVYDTANQRIIVSNRNGNTINVFDAATLTEITGSPFAVGTGAGSFLGNIGVVTLP